MAINTTEDAIAFIQANRLMFEGKTGFKHFAAQLSDLEEFVVRLAKENEELKTNKAQYSERDSTVEDCPF